MCICFSWSGHHRDLLVMAHSFPSLRSAALSSALRRPLRSGLSDAGAVVIDVIATVYPYATARNSIVSGAACCVATLPARHPTPCHGRRCPISATASASAGCTTRRGRRILPVLAVKWSEPGSPQGGPRPEERRDGREGGSAIRDP